MNSLDAIYPLIVPQDYYCKGTWELPHRSFPISDYILTWVFFKGSSAMSYIKEEEAEQLDVAHPGWQQRAFENLKILEKDPGHFFTYFKLSKDGTIIFLSFLNEDGIGSSRILLSNELRIAFPQGYHIAFPDRSCGMVIPKGIPENDLAEIRKMVKKMHRGATIPMSNKLFDPDEFELPGEWLIPVNPFTSSALVASIQDITPGQ